MKTFDWKCQTCGFVKEAPEPAPCPQCGDSLRKQFCFGIQPVARRFQPGFNMSLGEYVTSPQDFRDKLKKKGDQMSERLGTEHNYQPRDHEETPHQ